MGYIHKEYYSANARYLSDEAIKDFKISFGRGKSLDNSSNHGSLSLHTSVKTSDRQIKKRQSKPKSIRVSDLSTINDT
ncbi:14521_t:CDS:2 [Dentiscutata heterogama]|uniref:14521_t:CDS:1 n=1 Tax=Dentiscutata heterogama TaxID=1316150 RepID=A0ACA9MFC4_9GLOM|nr:14521_t:CDS:2 [Dentiscutata heterogama]